MDITTLYSMKTIFIVLMFLSFIVYGVLLANDKNPSFRLFMTIVAVSNICWIVFTHLYVTELEVQRTNHLEELHSPISIESIKILKDDNVYIVELENGQMIDYIFNGTTSTDPIFNGERRAAAQSNE